MLKEKETSEAYLAKIKRGCDWINKHYEETTIIIMIIIIIIIIIAVILIILLYIVIIMFIITINIIITSSISRSIIKLLSLAPRGPRGILLG